jgi:glycosyltransferase involved in cell wall biosynthesis
VATPPRSPDVSILLHDLQAGGAEKVCLTLAQCFAAEGLTVEFVLRQAMGDLLEEVPASISIHELEAPRVRQALLPFTHYLKTRRPSSVLAVLWPLTSLAVWARTLAGADCRVVTADHCILTHTRPGRSPVTRPAMSAAMRTSYGAADGVVAVSQGVAHDVAKLSGLPMSRVQVINNPITPLPPANPPDEAIVARWVQGEGPKLISVANLRVVKDQSTLLHALARVRERCDARLLILGQGPEQPRLEQLAASLGLTDAVTFGGFRRDPSGYVALADAFVLSSTTEGFGNVLVEALACGVPVISTDCPTGPGEILSPGVGRLVPIGDAGALADAVWQTLQEPVDRSALVQRAAHFSIDGAVAAYRGLLRV